MMLGRPPIDPARVTAFPKRLVALLALAVLFAPLSAPAGEAPKPRPTARLPFLQRYAAPARPPTRAPARTAPTRSTKIVVETDPDYEPEGSTPPKLPFLRRYAKPAPRTVQRGRSRPPARRIVTRPVTRPTNVARLLPSVNGAPARSPATVGPTAPPAPYAASPASAPTKNLPLDPSLKPGEKDPNRSIRLDMTRPYLR